MLHFIGGLFILMCLCLKGIDTLTGAAMISESAETTDHVKRRSLRNTATKIHSSNLWIDIL